MLSNRAAWQQECHTPLQVESTPYPDASTLAPNHLVMKVHAWAINPADIILQDTEMPFVKYPVILGEDIAGTILETGSGVARFGKGDRVIAFAVGDTQGAAMGGFQEYVVVEEELVCRIPGWMGFEEGVVLPLGLTTAAHALADREYLGLPIPGSGTAEEYGESESGIEGKSGTGKGKKTVLIWGASSSVGSNAVQLAVAAGLEVLATASQGNFEAVKKLGASIVFDYRAEGVVERVVRELDARGDCVGIFQAAGFAASLEPVLEVASKIQEDVFVATTMHLQEGVVPQGVRAKMVFGSGHDNVHGVWKEFLPAALEERRYFAAPEPLIIETKGLEGIQEGYDVLKKGVSAKKVVVLAE